MSSLYRTLYFKLSKECTRSSASLYRVLMCSLILCLTSEMSTAQAKPSTSNPSKPVNKVAQQNKSTVSAQVPVTLKGVTLKQLTAYHSPKLIDANTLVQTLKQTRSGLEALIHMSQMVSEEHARKALKAQISSLKAQINQLEVTLKESPQVDYSVPPPAPVEPRSKPNQRDKDSDERKESNRKPPDPMSATRLSQHWSALESAPFRDEKMAVIRTISRDEYLTVKQAELLIEGLAFSRDRQDAIVLIYPKLVDPDQANTLYQLLDHASHRRRVRKEVDRINLKRRQRGY